MEPQGLSRIRVLVIGQVPPPYSGQTVMTSVLVAGRYRHAELLHVNAGLSTSVAEMGTTSARKIMRLLGLLLRALSVSLRRRPRVLYYHPAGASRSAVLRDILLLPVLRPLFATVVFHLHARGLAAACSALPRPLRTLARRAYARPDVLLGPSGAIVDEAAWLAAGRQVVVPNGTPGGTPRTRYSAAGAVNVLFCNLVSEAKGAGWLLDSVATLVERGIDVRLTFVGEVSSPAYRDELRQRARKQGVAERVVLAGVAIGEEKWRWLAEADVFCVPTTWHQESFGVAHVEAASVGLPVVAADVPGVREVFEPGVSVLLADPADPPSLAEHLADVCTSAAVRERLGTAARAAYLARYTPEHYWHRIDEVFAVIGEASGVRS